MTRNPPFSRDSHSKRRIFHFFTSHPVPGDPSFYAGEVGGPLVELFGGLLQRDAELPSEGPEVGDVWCCDGAEYLVVDFAGDVAFKALLSVS